MPENNEQPPNNSEGGLIFNEMQKGTESLLHPKDKESAEKEGLLSRCNIWIFQYYQCLIIFLFVIIFISIPTILLIRRKQYQHLIKSSKDLNMDMRSFVNKRAYRQITLNNEMKILLVSDPDLSRCGAALRVNIGSANEPKTTPGLAHFLEHMLFFGSDKYPSSDLFFDFVGKHQGSTNAFTDDHSTTYYFEINENQFDKALDIWSRFFMDPLLKKEQAAKEVNAVNNEYEQDLMSNAWRYIELIRRIAHKDHPMHDFYIGNSKTLIGQEDKGGPDLVTLVRQFFKQYYSSNLINLVVLGPMKLDELEQYVVPKFSQVKNKKIDYYKVNNYTNTPAFNSDNLVNFVWYQPIGSHRMLTLFFYIKITNYKDKTAYNEQKKAVEYILKLINTDSKQGLRSLLRRLNYASFSRASYWEKSSDFLAIDMDISVTRQGLDHILEITQLFYEFMDQLKKHELNNEKFSESQLIQTIKYMYQDRSALDVYLLNYINKMNANPKFDPSSFLVRFDMLHMFNSTLYNNVINQISYNNSLVVVASELFEISPKYNLVTFDKGDAKKEIGQELKFKQVGEKSASNWISLNNVFSDMEKKFIKKQKKKENAEKKYQEYSSKSNDQDQESFNIFQFLQRQVISKPGHFYKKHNKKHNYDLLMNNINKVETNLEKIQGSNMKMTNLIEKHSNLNDNSGLLKQSINNQITNINHLINFKHIESTASSTAISRKDNSKQQTTSNDKVQTVSNEKTQISKSQTTQSNQVTQESGDPEEPDSKQILDTFDPYMNIYFSVEKISVEILKYLKEKKTGVFNDYKLEANRFIPVDMMINSKCYRTINEKTKENMKFKMNVIKQSSYLENINNTIGDKYDTAEIRKQYLDFNCHLEELRGDLRVDTPVLVVSNSVGVLWAKLDRSYLYPKGSLKLQLTTSIKYNKYNQVMSNLLMLVLGDRLKEELFDASFMGYQLNMGYSQKGFDFYVSGFTDKLDAAMLSMVQIFTNYDFTEEDFDQNKEYLLGQINRSNFQGVMQNIQDVLSYVMIDNYNLDLELLEELQAATYKQLQDFRKGILKTCSIVVLEVGNLNQPKLLNMFTQLSVLLANIQEIPLNNNQPLVDIDFITKNKEDSKESPINAGSKSNDNNNANSNIKIQTSRVQRKNIEINSDLKKDQSVLKFDNNENNQTNSEVYEDKIQEIKNNEKVKFEKEIINDEEQSGQYQQPKKSEDEKEKEKTKEKLEEISTDDAEKDEEFQEDKHKSKQIPTKEQKQQHHHHKSNLFRFKGHNKNNDIDNRILKLNTNETLVYRQLNKKKDDLNHGILNFYQLNFDENLLADDSDGSLSNQRKIMLLTRLVQSIIGKQAFSFLRTEHQLGYSVYTSYISFENTDGIYVCIQGSAKNPKEMDEKIELFLLNFMEYLKNKNEQEFKNAVSSAMNQLRSRDSSLDTKLNKFWKDIVSQKGSFNKQQLYLETLSKLTKDDFLEYFQKHLLNEPRKLSIQIYSQQQLINQEQPLSVPTDTAVETNGRPQKVITDAALFKAMPRFESSINKLKI